MEYLTRFPRATRQAAFKIAFFGVIAATMAQSEPAQEPSDTESASESTIVVVGSRIATAPEESSHSVIVLGRSDIEQRGVTSVSELLLRLPVANQGSLVGNNDAATFASGATGVSLRGLGLNATLVLLNGRRLAPYGFSHLSTISFINLESLPLAAVERIEILTEGASALYGADAIAGVVNIVTKKSVRGTELELYYGNTQETDVGTTSGAISFGGGNQKTDFFIEVDYLRRNDLFNRDRSFSSDADLRPLGGINGGSSFSYPGRFTVPRTAPGLVGTPFAIGPGPTVNLVAPHATDGLTPPGGYHVAGPDDFFNFLAYSQALPSTEQIGVYTNASYRIFEERLELFGEVLFRHNETHLELAPPFVNLQGSGSGLGIPLGTVVYRNGVRIVGNAITIPIDNPFNPFGVPISSGRYRLVEAGNRLYDITSDSGRVVAGFRGKLSEAISYETAGYFAWSNEARHVVNVGTNELQRALNDPDPATALNPFNGPNSPNNPATLESLKVRYTNFGSTELGGADFKVFGNLLDLPAGPLGYAAGAEYRFEQFVDDPNQLQRDGAVVGSSPMVGNSGDREVVAIFAEANVPLIKPEWSVPGVHKLILDLAGRLDMYSDFGEEVVPRVGLSWLPLSEDFVFHAGYGQSFRPPSLQQLFTAPSDALTPAFRDPLRGEDLQEVPISRGGNPDLSPERAKQWTLGFVLTPRAVKSLRLDAQWVHIKRTDEIGFAPFGLEDLARTPGNYVRGPYDGRPGALIDPATGSPAGPLISLSDFYRNFGTTIVESLDFDLHYQIPTPAAGTFTLGVNTSYLMRYEVSNGFGTTRDQAGEVRAGTPDAIPQLQTLATLSWEFRRFNAAVVCHNVSGVDYINPVSMKKVGVDSFTTFDLQASYRFKYDITCSIGIKNVLDTAPPVYVGTHDGGYAYLSNLHDPLGRFFYLKVNKRF